MFRRNLDHHWDDKAVWPPPARGRQQPCSPAAPLPFSHLEQQVRVLLQGPACKTVAQLHPVWDAISLSMWLLTVTAASSMATAVLPTGPPTPFLMQARRRRA